MNDAVQLVNLTKRFGKTVVLDNVNLNVPLGSVYALIGPNGAGKSTTLQILMNIHQPTLGKAEIFGHDSRRNSPEDFARIAYVSEAQEMPDWMTVSEFFDYVKPFYPAWDSDREYQLLRHFELPPKRKLRHLSRGMRMKASLASSLAYRPSLIILDEPFSGLDPLVRDEVVESLVDNLEDATVLISSHDLGEIESFATAVGYLDAGKLHLSEELSSLTDRFREVEVTVKAQVSRTLDWPASWLNVECSPSLVRFIDSQYQPDLTAAEVRHVLGDSRQFSAKPMPLRAIFTTLAKSRKRAA